MNNYNNLAAAKIRALLQNSCDEDVVLHPKLKCPPHSGKGKQAPQMSMNGNIDETNAELRALLDDSSDDDVVLDPTLKCPPRTGKGQQAPQTSMNSHNDKTNAELRELLDASSDDEVMLVPTLECVKKHNNLAKMATGSARNLSVTPTSPMKSSVFGPQFDDAANDAWLTDLQLKAIVYDRSARHARQQEVAELRKNMQVDKENNQDMKEVEKFVNMIIESETQNEKERLLVHDKYYCSLALFLNPPALPKPNARYWKRSKTKKHPLHTFLLSAIEAGDNLGVGFRTTVKFWCEHGSEIPKRVVQMLFHRVVYDDTDDKPGTLDREEEFQSLLHIIEKAIADFILPSMTQVLCAYGATLPDSNPDVKAIDNAPDESLDKQMFSSNVLERSSELVLRNLGRAFGVWTAQIKSETDIKLILGQGRPIQVGYSRSTPFRLGIVGLCVQVLLSPFGSRLRHSVGTLLEATLDGVHVDEWKKFRQRCVRDILTLTSRLGLLVELVTYLLPIRQPRSRALGLDLSYLTMWRWHRGPAENPFPVDVPKRWPSSVKKIHHPISYKLSDVLECMQRIPELGKTTDVHWCCALMRILKMCLVDNMVLDSRQEGEIARVNALIKKFSMCAHRMLFGVPRQNLRLALDATLAGLRVFLGLGVASMLKSVPHNAV